MWLIAAKKRAGSFAYFAFPTLYSSASAVFYLPADDRSVLPDPVGRPSNPESIKSAVGVPVGFSVSLHSIACGSRFFFGRRSQQRVCAAVP